jgi:PAS domain S-box-containing protein
MQTFWELDRVAEVLPVGILRADAWGRCGYLNPRACETLGVTRAEARGFGWMRRLSPEDGKEVLRAWAEAAPRLEPFTLVVVVRPADAPERTVSCRVAPVLDAPGGVRAHLAVVERADDDERWGEVTAGAVAAGIAHEVSQPLTAVATYAQACRRLIEGGAAGPADLLDILARIRHEAERAGDIVDRLKDMARHRETRRSACDVGALVRDTEPLALVEARLHDVRLVVDIQPDLPRAMADPVQIQEVILNLTRNGIEATAARGGLPREVRLGARLGPTGFLEVRVQDHGHGVPEEAECRLFEPFFTTKPGGMGMGLTISRSIVSAHRGRIGFTRDPGGGATFWFTLPVLGGPQRGSG